MSGLKSRKAPFIRFIERFSWISSPRLLLAGYIFLAAFLTAYQLWRRPDSMNNFIIFRTSFDYLCQNGDLYAAHPEHEDVFRYSPTFAFFMAPFRALPIGIALLLWNLCNALAPYFAVRSLPITRAAAAAVLLFILPQLNGSIQNNQSNGVMTGLMIGTLGAMERGRMAAASLLSSLGFLIKVYGAGVGMLFLCYPKKVRFIVSGLIAFAILALLPVTVTGVDGLWEHYREWVQQIGTGGPRAMKYSVMTVFEKWTGRIAPDWMFTLPGLVLLLLPLVRVKQYRHRAFRIMYAAYIMIFAVIFNPMAESPTYIIAMTGAAVWGLVEPRTWVRLVMLFLVYFVTGLAHSDLCPEWIRDPVVARYGLKAVPCIAVWGIMAWRLIACDAGKFSTEVLTSLTFATPLSASERPSDARPV